MIAYIVHHKHRHGARYALAKTERDALACAWNIIVTWWHEIHSRNVRAALRTAYREGNLSAALTIWTDNQVVNRRDDAITIVPLHAGEFTPVQPPEEETH